MVICCYIKDVSDPASLPQVLSGLRFHVHIPVYTSEMGNYFLIIFVIYENIKEINAEQGFSNFINFKQLRADSSVVFSIYILCSSPAY